MGSVRSMMTDFDSPMPTNSGVSYEDFIDNRLLFNKWGTRTLREYADEGHKDCAKW